MDDRTVREITKLQTMFEVQQQDLAELKVSMKELKKCIPSMEAHNTLDVRITKIEGNINKLTWLVISAVVGALLSMILKS